MHPLKKTARIAGAFYLSMVVTGPFSLICRPVHDQDEQRRSHHARRPRLDGKGQAGHRADVSSAWCVVCAFVFQIFPEFAGPVNPYWFDSPMTIFEIVLSFSLLFKGLQIRGQMSEVGNR